MSKNMIDLIPEGAVIEHIVVKDGKDRALWVNITVKGTTDDAVLLEYSRYAFGIDTEALNQYRADKGLPPYVAPVYLEVVPFTRILSIALVQVPNA